MTSKFDDEEILITGASSGLGKAFAFQLGSKNRLLLCGRNQSQLSESFPQHQVFQADLTKISDIELINERLQSQHSPTSAILAAGGGTFSPFLNASFDDIANDINLNITGNVALMHMLIPKLITNARHRNLRAKLLVVSSHAAFLRVPNFATYASAKKFLINL